MDILAYTTYDEVRALLGVSQDELEDGTLALSVYATGLEADLRDISSSLLTTYASANSATNPTDDQAWFVRSVNSFAAFSVARQLAGSLPMFAPKDISDSKASLSRYASSPYEVTIDYIKGQYQVQRDRVEKALQAVASSTIITSSVPIFFAVASASVDPVTGA